MRIRSVILALLALSFATLAHAQDKKFLAEVFANVNCNNCRVPDDAFNSFVASHPDIQILNIHNSNTWTEDPFYLSANPSAETRDKFYSAGAGLTDPVAFINGYYGGTGLDQEPSWEKTYKFSTPLTPIAITKSVIGDEKYSFTVTVTAQNPAKLYIALKESKVYYQNSHSYGPMPNDLWDDIFRKMLPTETGTANFIGTKTFTIPYDHSGDGDWIVDNMEAIAFVQDVAEADATHSHVIESMGIVPLGAGAGVNSDATQTTDRLHLASNPTANFSHFSVELSKPSDVRVVMTDLLGREVQTIANRNFPQGSTSINLEGQPIESGCYLLQLFVDGRMADQQKLIVE